MEIRLETLSGTGVQTEPVFEGVPDASGVLQQYLVHVPEFERAAYYAAYQRHDPIAPNQPRWVEGANRCQPLAVSDFRSVRTGGLFALLKLSTGDYLALLPLVGVQTAAWFSSDLGDLTLNVGTLGTGVVRGDLPLLAWARAEDAYVACHRVWEAAIHHLGAPTRLREEKHYPEVLRYLGWCSWEEYRGEITADVLVDAVRAIRRSVLPIRYVLVDDGHLDHQGRQLLSFEPNDKFPDGWAPLLGLRDPNGVRWMGVWLNFNGYWDGVSRLNRLGDLNTHLAPDAVGERLLPRLGLPNSVAFYDAMIGAARTAGFDFVKIDNQAGNLDKYRGTEQPVAAAVENAQALEIACARHMDGLINCMAHGVACIFNSRISAVTRCSEDYQLGDLGRARRHLHNSYGNMPWLGQTVWGDHDMFHSNDPVSGRMMAISKAVSGGPVYLSDAPDDFVDAHVKPLCYADGELLRPLAPAAPLEESIFLDPFDDVAAFRVIAPLANGAVAIVVYNLTEPEVSVVASITATDYAQAGAMDCPPSRWSVPDEGLVLYDWAAGDAVVLTDAWRTTLPYFDDRLLLLLPIMAGWAVVGRCDKYLSPVAVEVLQATPKRLLLRMVEAGPLRIWRRDGEVSSPQADVQGLGGGLWQVEYAVGRRDFVVELVVADV
jgi:hypothetical protein